MAEEIWVSSVGSNSQLFNKPGIREKHYGQDWAPPKFEHDAPTKEQANNSRRHVLGEKLKREEFVEAAYVFDPKRWSRVKDFFAVDGFFAVKGKLAELLKDFDLGDGELVEFPIHEMDKTTQLPGPFYFLNFGSQKDCLLPEDSRNLSAGPVNPKTGFRRWRAIEPKGEDIAVSASALGGPDLWVDPKFSGKIFMSGRLHDAIEGAKLKIDFRFAKTRIVPE
ncbi:imm11 family protein [Roseibium sp.]|uniref:imm11 family protein n=1 Tax=Roseibium sp. TaxID=1936156 RepID=UPI003B52B027